MYRCTRNAHILICLEDDLILFEEPKAKTDELIRIWTQEQIDGVLHRSSDSGLSTGSILADSFLVGLLQGCTVRLNR